MKSSSQRPSPLGAFSARKTTLRLVGGATALATSMTLVACGGGQEAGGQFDGEVKVGILHSRSGTMAISENTVAEAELMAIDEINKAGGVKVGGKKLKIVPIEEDGASDWPTFAEKSKKLIDQDQVAVVFGGWTSASRKAMLPVFEAKDHFLFYPIQYEGQECSKNIFYSGAAPNQQAEPAVDWLLKNKGKDFFLVGSDYVYPRTANTIMKEQLKASGGKVVGEDYLPLGNTEVAPIIAKIKQALCTASGRAHAAQAACVALTDNGYLSCGGSCSAAGQRAADVFLGVLIGSAGIVFYFDD